MRGVSIVIHDNGKPLKLQWVDFVKRVFLQSGWNLTGKMSLRLGKKKKQTIQQEEWQREQHSQDLTQSPESKPIWLSRVPLDRHIIGFKTESEKQICTVFTPLPQAPGPKGRWASRVCGVQALVLKVMKHPGLNLEALLAGSRTLACSRYSLSHSRVTRVL